METDTYKVLLDFMGDFYHALLVVLCWLVVITLLSIVLVYGAAKEAADLSRKLEPAYYRMIYYDIVYRY